MLWAAAQAWAEVTLHWRPRDGELQNIGNEASVSHTVSGVPLSHSTQHAVLTGSQSIQQMQGHGNVNQEPRGCQAQHDATPCLGLSGSPGR